MANKVRKKDNFKAIIEVLKTQGKDNLVEVYRLCGFHLSSCILNKN